MNKKKIELQVLNISNSQAQAGAYAMVLGEINGMRQLPVIIGSAEAQSMMIEMRGIVPPRPLTPYAVCLSSQGTGGNLAARAYLQSGQRCFLFLPLYENGRDHPAHRRTYQRCRGPRLAHGCPIFIYDDILEAECLKTEHSITPTQQTDDAAADAATRKKTLKQLKEALQNAIDAEDYERAAQLRDIINQHKKP